MAITGKWLKSLKMAVTMAFGIPWFGHTPCLSACQGPGSIFYKKSPPFAPGRAESFLFHRLCRRKQLKLKFLPFPVFIRLYWKERQCCRCFFFIAPQPLGCPRETVAGGACLCKPVCARLLVKFFFIYFAK